MIKGGVGGLRKKKHSGGQEAEGVETEQKKKKRETGMRPNVGRQKCFQDVVKQAASHPTYQHSSLRCIHRERSTCFSVGLYAGADSRHCF